MYKILITGSIHQIGLEILRKEKDIEKSSMLRILLLLKYLK